MATGSPENLKDQCAHALRDYVKEAQRTCALIEAIGELPIDAMTRDRLLGQRIAENAARVQYDSARERFFNALRGK